MKNLEGINYQLYMLIGYKMYKYVSYKGSKLGVQKAPPCKHFARCYLNTPF